MNQTDSDCEELTATDNSSDIPDDAWQVLKNDLSSSRVEKLEKAASLRTDTVRLVIQDVHDPHNVSACLRSAEAFGIQHVHVITLGQSFRPTTVARGVKNWLTIHKHDSIEECVRELKKNGFLICAGMPGGDSVPLEALPIREEAPLAILFGNEHAGVSPDWDQVIDQKFTIPMNGLVESLNISVSAAVCMHFLTLKAREYLKDKYYLTEPKKRALLNVWCSRTVKNWEKRYERLKNP